MHISDKSLLKFAYHLKYFLCPLTYCFHILHTSLPTWPQSLNKSRQLLQARINFLRIMALFSLSNFEYFFYFFVYIHFTSKVSRLLLSNFKYFLTCFSYYHEGTVPGKLNLTLNNTYLTYHNGLHPDHPQAPPQKSPPNKYVYIVFFLILERSSNKWPTPTHNWPSPPPPPHFFFFKHSIYIYFFERPSNHPTQAIAIKLEI